MLVLAWVARVHWRGHALGVWSYTLLLVGGLMTAWAVHPLVYALGFLLVIGFDKMFSVYIRAGRQRIIPPQDFGKTSGVVVLLTDGKARPPCTEGDTRFPHVVCVGLSCCDW